MIEQARILARGFLERLLGHRHLSVTDCYAQVLLEAAERIRR